MNEDIVASFWSAPDEAVFTRDEVAIVRRCSTAKLEREAWEQTGIPFIKDGNRALYKKRDVVARLNGAQAGAA